MPSTPLVERIEGPPTWFPVPTFPITPLLSGPGKLPRTLIGVPVIRREFDAPEPRARREKFNSNTHALVRRIAQGDNSTCLLFFGGKIGEDNIGADFTDWCRKNRPPCAFITIVSVSSLNSLPSAFLLEARTGMFIQSRRLRRSVLMCTFDMI